MATTTVRLSPSEEQLLDDLASSYGGRSNAIRQAILLLASRVQRQRALSELLEAWEKESGALGDEEVDAVADYYDL